MRMLSDSPAADDASTAPLLVTPASAASATCGALLPPTGGSGGASFDANMVIILAVLLCVLVCALDLNSLIRCALHWGRTLTVAAPPTTAVATVAAPAAEGLKKRELRKIPVAVYEAKAGVPGTECAICLGEFADGEKVRVLPRCHHGFHGRCIDMWLAAHSSCPICRNSLLEEGGAGEATVAGEGIGSYIIGLQFLAR